ncbi:MAG: response regulator [Anaerolineae bacterium]|nr:response regulator [Anaerolineae bacterium]
MSTTRIFVLSDHMMFAHGIQSLLSCDLDYQIVGHDADVDKAIEKIKSLAPDIIIFDSSGPSRDKIELKRILLARPGTRVIGLSLNNNNLYIYHATQRIVQSIDDFREAIDHASLFENLGE